MEQPPAQTKVPPVCLKVVAVGLFKVVVVVVLEVDARALGGWLWCSKRDNRGEIVAAAKEVQLDSRKKREEAEGVEKSKGSGYGWSD